MFYDAIQISKLNDFIFCPRSIYLHDIYYSFDSQVFQGERQIAGQINHSTIDCKKYSSLSRYIQSLEVYSQQYNLIGKIDIYDQKTETLIERKTMIKEIYLGYWLQLYAQKIAMLEMGYKVNKLKLYSLQSNQTYFLDQEDFVRQKFEEIMSAIHNLKIDNLEQQSNINKCLNCIYKELCRGDL